MQFLSKYATLLTPADVLKLFKLLEEVLGSHSAAADACDLTRKTAYDWTDVKDLKLETKIKLLNALMENLPEETLDYLTHRAVDSASDILMVYLSAMYESIIDETKHELLIKKLESFDEIRNKYSGLITGRFDSEISDKIFYLQQKAKEFHLNWLPKPTSMVTVEQACTIIPIIIEKIVLGGGDVTDKNISNELNISEELVRTIRFSLQQTVLSKISPDLRRHLEAASKAIANALTNTQPSFTQEIDITSNTAGTSSEQR